MTVIGVRGLRRLVGRALVVAVRNRGMLMVMTVMTEMLAMRQRCSGRTMSRMLFKHVANVRRDCVRSVERQNTRQEQGEQ